MTQSYPYDGKRLAQEVTLILNDEPYTGAGRTTQKLLNAVLQYASENDLQVIFTGGGWQIREPDLSSIFKDNPSSK